MKEEDTGSFSWEVPQLFLWLCSPEQPNLHPKKSEGEQLPCYPFKQLWLHSHRKVLLLNCPYLGNILLGRENKTFMCDTGKGQAAQKLTWNGAEYFQCGILDSLGIQSLVFRFYSVTGENRYHSIRNKLQLSYSDS